MQASLVQKQQFGVKMNPQVYQSIKLMELPLVDLREKIEEELERNPALELVEDRSTVSLDEAEAEAPGEEEEYFETSSDSGFSYTGGGAGALGGASDEHHRFIEGALTRPETLQQHLLWQLQLEPIDDELRAIAAILIQNLDDDGFHKEPPETLFKESETFPQIPPPRLAEAISLVQTLDPVGCCTADYQESLKVQAALLVAAESAAEGDTEGTAKGAVPPPCMECAPHYLEILERGRFAEAAKKMNCSKDEARSCFDLIKKLSPFPGRLFNAVDIRFVVPDMQVVRGDAGSGDFVIVLNDEVIPALGINPFFKSLNARKKSAKDNHAGDSPDIAKDTADRSVTDHTVADRTVRQFARENIREAKVFINSLAMRKHTLKMVASAILSFQQDFFEKGPQFLAPLTLNDIAEKLGIHETTVSRAANGKYMQTEWGIFELRYFFTNSISGSGSSGSSFSKEGVKAIIHEMITTESKSISDIDISELLAKRGISLARRTVAKYRKELDLGSSYAR